MSRRAAAAGCLLLVFLGLGVTGLAAVAPGLPDGPVVGAALFMVAVGLVNDVLDLVSGKRPKVPNRTVATACKVAACVALYAYVASRLARTPVPLAWVGGLLLGIGLGDPGAGIPDGQTSRSCCRSTC